METNQVVLSVIQLVTLVIIQEQDCLIALPCLQVQLIVKQDRFQDQLSLANPVSLYTI